MAILETIAAADVRARKTREKAAVKKDISMLRSPEQQLKDNIAQEEAENEFEKETEKATMLIQRMQKYGPDCSIKFVQKPHRLDLMFEKSFAMAVKQNNNDILDLFPINSIKTAYVSMHQLKDYKQYKNDKERHVEQLTTPLHLACQNSNIEAV